MEDFMDVVDKILRLIIPNSWKSHRSGICGNREKSGYLKLYYLFAKWRLWDCIKAIGKYVKNILAKSRQAK
jgi:hypothetical protein